MILDNLLAGRKGWSSYIANQQGAVFVYQVIEKYRTRPSRYCCCLGIATQGLECAAIGSIRLEINSYPPPCASTAVVVVTAVAKIAVIMAK